MKIVINAFDLLNRPRCLFIGHQEELLFVFTLPARALTPSSDCFYLHVRDLLALGF
jgi:hypothetical protein